MARSHSARRDRRAAGAVLVCVALALAGQALLSVRVRTADAQAAETARGFNLFSTSCASCHGTQAEGIPGKGPSLAGAGPAGVDFMLSTGRMPIADPDATPVRATPRFSRAEIDAIIDYVTSIRPGGPPIPSIDVSAGDLATGNELFQGNCAACHGAAAQGGSVGGGQVAPALDVATPTQIAEALRVGPGVMPRFGPEQLPDEDVESLARYLVFLRSSGNEGGTDLGRVGPVSEGFVAWVVGLGILIVAIRFAGTKT
jgi:ubiquinol-cytochrome c reductase cytochrome c subunit